MLQRQELHRHARHLDELDRTPAVPDQRLGAGAGKEVKGVAHLVQQHVQVVGGADHVHDHERHARLLQTLAVGVAHLARAAGQIEQPAAHLGKLRAQRRVEGVEDPLGDAFKFRGGLEGRQRGPSLGVQGSAPRIVPGPQTLQTELPGLGLHQFGGQRHHLVQHRLMKVEAVLRRVVHPVEFLPAVGPVIAQIGIGGQLTAGGEQVEHQIVERRTAACPAADHRPPDLLAARPVGAAQQALGFRHRQLRAVEHHRLAAGDLGVALHLPLVLDFQHHVGLAVVGRLSAHPAVGVREIGGRAVVGHPQQLLAQHLLGAAQRGLHLGAEGGERFAGHFVGGVEVGAQAQHGPGLRHGLAEFAPVGQPARHPGGRQLGLTQRLVMRRIRVPAGLLGAERQGVGHGRFG